MQAAGIAPRFERDLAHGPPSMAAKPALLIARERRRSGLEARAAHQEVAFVLAERAVALVAANGAMVAIARA